MKMRLILITGIVVITTLLWMSLHTSRAGYESPAYETIQSEQNFEIRKYPDMFSASTSMDEDSSRNSGFGRLFRFISGDNEEKEKISMTTPVFIEENQDAQGGKMMFVMPEETVRAGVPRPSAKEVRLETVAGGMFAAFRFKGYRSPPAQKNAVATLRQWIDKQGYHAAGQPVFAYYDPPWTPEILRRNEVLIRVEKGK